MMISGSTQLEALRAVVQNPEGFYVLLTGTDNPDGLLRGQLSQSGDSEMESLSDKLDRMQKQLDTIQQMVRTVGRVLGIDPQFLPEPGGTTPADGSGDSSNPSTP
jgi:hypothetical protein